MIYQETLTGKQQAPWDFICCEACWNATEERCTCHCGGTFHGAGRNNQDAPEDPTLSREQAQHFREHITKTRCWDARHPSEEVDLSMEPILYYPHSGGWPVPGLAGTYWLYITCPKCGYQWALWKLGVPRTLQVGEDASDCYCEMQGS